MKLNPITALFDPLERLINEHGSAAILRDHVALFKDQLSILKEKFSILETENMNLKMENQNLKTENDQLKEKIQIHEKPTHNNLVDEIKLKILLYLSKRQRQTIDIEIAQAFNIDLQLVKFHLEELEQNKMVHGTSAVGQPRQWSLVQEGRRYLIKNKLIS